MLKKNVTVSVACKIHREHEAFIRTRGEENTQFAELW